MFKGLLKSPAFLFGAGLFVLTLLLAFFAPLVMTLDAKTRVGLAYVAPSAGHWLGTDHLGLDMLARLVAGLRSSLYVGFMAGIVATVVGTLIGVYGGYKGGLLDDVLTEENLSKTFGQDLELQKSGDRFFARRKV